jgi:MFS family permease
VSRRSLSRYTRETLQFFGQPISFLLREQIMLLLLAIAVVECAFSSSVICLPLYFYSLPETSYHAFASGLELTVILVVYYLVSLSSASFFGSLSDRIGRRPLLITGTLIAGLSFGPFPIVFPLYSNFEYSFWILLGANTFKGLASAMMSGPVLAMFADLAPEQSHGETMGKFYLFRSAGGASGFLIGGIAWDLFSVNAFFLFMIIMLTASALYIFRFYEPRGEIPSSDDHDKKAIGFSEIVSDSGINPFKTMVESLQNKQFRKFAIAWLAYTTLVGAGGTYAPVILKEVTEGGVGASYIGLIFLFGVAIMGIIQPKLGKLSDSLGRKPFLVIGCVGTSLIIVMFTAILKLDAVDFIDLIQNPLSISKTKPLEFAPNIPISFPHMIIVLTLLILLLSAACFASSSLALITDVTAEGSRGREMGFTQAIMATGSILGTTFGGTLFESSGTLGVMTFCFGLSLIAVIIILQFLYETSGFYHFTHKLV